MSLIDGMPQVDKLNKFILGHIACFYKKSSFTRPTYITYIPHSACSTGLMGNLLKKGKAKIVISSGLARLLLYTPLLERRKRSA